MKVAIIGAGNVGGTLAKRVCEENLAGVVLVDSLIGIAEAKAMDLCDGASITGANQCITGTSKFSGIKGSDIVVITAGFPRQPGMTREDLLNKNIGIIKEVIAEIKKYCPKAIIIIVTNPLDVMTYVAIKQSGFEHERVIGMGGALDSSRFSCVIANELGVNAHEVNAMVIGAHSDKMLPLPRFTTVKGKPLTKILPAKKISELMEETKQRGGRIVGLLGGKGSAYYAPSAGIFSVVRAIIEDKKEAIPCSVYLDGEYGLKDMCIGVPVILGRKGIKKIIELDLNKEELQALKDSAESVRESLNLLK